MNPVNATRRPIVRAGIAAVGAAALLGGLIYAGRLMRDSLRGDDRYQFPLQQIECPSPPSMDREQFLSEVRYYSELPETVSLLDENLRQRLTEAFRRHAWVERVDGVEISSSRRIQVKLTFRQPVLVVAYLDQELVERVIDRSGNLLPRTHDIATLPHLAGRIDAPTNGIGRPWGNARVESAARVAGLLHECQSQLQLTEVNWKGGEIWLKRSNGQEIAWGKPDDMADQSKAIHLLELISTRHSNNPIDLRSN